MDYGDFQNDFIEKYSESDHEEIESLITMALEDDKESSLGGWNLSLNKEKHDALNFTYHINLSKEGNGDYDEEVNLSFYTGINVGCELVDYSLDGDSISSKPKFTSVLVDIIPDMQVIELNLGKKANKEKATLLLNANKTEIMEIYNKQNYDNYHTGGGTLKTDSHYKSKFDKFHSWGLYWTCVYDEVEVDRNFV